MPSRPYYTVAELAELTRLHHNTIKGYAVRGKLDAFKLPGKTGQWLIPSAAGDAFLESIRKPVAS